MTTPKGTFERKRWEVVGTKEGVNADGTKRLTVCMKRKKKSQAKTLKMELKKMELLAEQAQQSREEKRKRRLSALAKEAFALNPGPPSTTKPVRAAAVVKVGAFAWAAMEQQDSGTADLVRMIHPAVLADDDKQKSHAPLSGRGGRTLVKTVHEEGMYRPGEWPDHVEVFTETGMYSGPSKKRKRMESDSESSGEESLDSDSDGVDTWYQCDGCDEWENLGDKHQNDPAAGYVCTRCDKSHPRPTQGAV